MPGRLDLYDDRAKRVLALAQDEAWRVFHHRLISPEHLLLGVLRGCEGSLGAALDSLGLDLVKARNALEALSGRGDPQQQLDEFR
jgi:ATP-dependent Clp protease ATP-binding subunit ClpA